MPSTPTVNLTADSSNHRIRVEVTNPGTNPDHNQVHRRISGESVFTKISDTLPPDGTFDDYNVPADTNIDYFIRGVDAGGATADSIVYTTSITLTDDLRIHKTTKRNASNNLSGSVLTLWSEGPHSRTHSLAAETVYGAGEEVPDVNLGEIEEEIWNLPVTIRLADDATRLALQALYESKAVLCLRTPGGERLFGSIDNSPENFSDRVTNLNLRFQVLDYSEAIS